MRPYIQRQDHQVHTNEQLFSRYQTPFAPKIEGMELPKKFNPLKFNMYDGKIRPEVVHQLVFLNDGTLKSPQHTHMQDVSIELRLLQAEVVREASIMVYQELPPTL